MERKMTLRDGKQVGVESRSDEEREERNHGRGDFQVQYLEQGRECPGEDIAEQRQEEEDLPLSEETGQEDRQESKKQTEEKKEETDVMNMLKMMWGDMNRMEGDMNANLNREMNNIRDDMNNIRNDMNKNKEELKQEINIKMDQNKEEIKQEMNIKMDQNKEEIKQTKDLIIKLMEEKLGNIEKKLEKSNTYMEHKLASTKQEIRGEVIGRIMEIENLQINRINKMEEKEKDFIEEIQVDLRKQNENINTNDDTIEQKSSNKMEEKIGEVKIQSMMDFKEVEKETEEIQFIKIQRHINEKMIDSNLQNLRSEEAMKIYEKEIHWKITDPDVNTSKQIVTYSKRNNNNSRGINFNWELEEMNKILQETKEEIEENIGQNIETIIYAENFEMRFKLGRNIKIINPRIFNRTIENEIIRNESFMGNEIIKRRNNDMKKLEMQILMNLLVEIDEIGDNKIEKDTVKNSKKLRKQIQENQTIREENKTKFRKRK